MINRRTFLNYSGGIIGSFFINPIISHADQQTDKKFIFILLRGGMDGLSLIPPFGLDEYYSLRPTISIPKKHLLKLNDKFGMHPSFKNSLFEFYQNDNLILLPQSGQTNNSRSHFQAQDEMEYGNKQIKSDTGFLNRMAKSLEHHGATSFTPGLPEVFKGDFIINNIKLDSYYSNINQYNEKQIKENYSQNKKLTENLDKIISSNEFISSLNNKYKNYSSNDIGHKIGTYIKEANINVSFLELLDWDTHVNSGVLDGRILRLFDNLNKTLVTLKNGLGNEWNNTTIVINTEFGRGIKENGSKGTEHGHGGLMMVTGGNVKKSQIVGDIKSLKLTDAFENRDLHVTHEYREVIASLLKNHMQMKKENIDYIFPNLNYSLNLS